MADRELPPLRVKLIGDDSSYKSMMDRASKQADALAKQVAAVGRKASSSGKGGFFNAQEQAIFDRLRAEERAAAILEKLTLRRMRLQEDIAKREERRLFSQMQLAEKAAKREESRILAIMALKEKEAKREERRLFSQMQIWERIAKQKAAAERRETERAERRMRTEEAHSKRMAGMQASQARAAQIHQQRLFNAQQAQQRANAAAQQRSQQSAQSHQQRMRASQTAINRQNAMALQRMQQSQTRHAQQLFNSAVANRRQNAAAQQRLHAAQATAQQRAARAAANLNNANAAAQQRLANAQMSQYRQNAATQQRMQQSAQMHQARLARQAQILANGNRRAGGGGGGYGGLAGRADIYMGTHGIRNIMAGVAGPAQSAMDFQDAGIAMTAYTGSAEKAAAALQEVQQFALMSPYSSKTLIDNAKSMMSYGISSEKTLEMLKQLGNVAGGNAERMHLLAYAMAQVNSMGVLQGQELRQLTESGFNPLMVMAKDMTNTEEEATAKFKELKEAMSDGKITAEMVGKALQNVTTKGGMFAGLLDKLNNSTRGLTNQFLEYADLIQRNLFAAIQDQIDEFLKSGVAYMKFISDMISQNKELAKSIATWVWRVVVAVTAILAFTVVMATARWILHAVIPLLGFAYSGLVLLARGAMLAWTAMLTPVGAVIAAIAVVAAAIAVLTFGWSGVASGAKWAFDNALGFMWNFGENAQAIFTWLGEAWNQTWTNMFAGMRLTWSDMSGWLADKILEVGWMFGGLTDKQLEQAKAARLDATNREQNKMAAGVKGLPSLKLNTSLPKWEMPKYEESNTPIEDKENVDWNAMMGKGKGDESNKAGSTGSLDITAVTRGSADAEARARAFMAGIGKPISSTGDRKKTNEEKMAKFLRDIERNTRNPVKIDTASVV